MYLQIPSPLKPSQCSEWAQFKMVSVFTAKHFIVIYIQWKQGLLGGRGTTIRHNAQITCITKMTYYSLSLKQNTTQKTNKQ